MHESGVNYMDVQPDSDRSKVLGRCQKRSFSFARRSSACVSDPMSVRQPDGKGTLEQVEPFLPPYQFKCPVADSKTLTDSVTTSRNLRAIRDRPTVGMTGSRLMKTTGRLPRLVSFLQFT